MLGPAHPRLPLGCAPSVRTRPVDGSDCPLVVKHDGFTGSQRQHHTPEQTHSHPVSRLVTVGTVGPHRVVVCALITNGHSNLRIWRKLALMAWAVDVH
jgi:hypothetical protein